MSKRTIAILDKKAGIKLTKDFSSNEFDCKCSNSSCKTTLIDLEHVITLQKLRDLVGPLKITSGFRCKKHNKSVGGSDTSQHLKGTATDIQSKRIQPNIIQATADVMFNGVGSYDTFTHVDSREGTLKARWNQRND